MYRTLENVIRSVQQNTVSEEAEASKKRMEIKAVARPEDKRDGPVPTRQAEYKTKVVDEAKKCEDDEDEDDDKDEKKASKGKTEVVVDPPIKKMVEAKSDEKSLAALAPPRDKVTRKDILVGRGIKLKREERLADLIGVSKSLMDAVKSVVESKPEEDQVDEAIYKIAKGTKRPGMSLMDDPRVKRALALDRALGKLPPEPKKDKDQEKKEEVVVESLADETHEAMKVAHNAPNRAKAAINKLAAHGKDKYSDEAMIHIGATRAYLERGMVDKARDSWEKARKHIDESVNEATHVFHVHLKSVEPRGLRIKDPHGLAGDRIVYDEPPGKEERGAEPKIVLRVKADTRTKALNMAARHVAKNYGASNVKSIVHKGIAEEVEQVDEAKLSPEDFMKGARRAGTGTDDQLKASASKKNAGPGSGKIRQLSKDELKRRGVKEEFSAEEIARLEEIYSSLDEMIHYDRSRSEDDITHFNIVNKKTKAVVGKAKTKASARKARDSHDMKYGAAVHSAVAVYKPQ